MKANSLGARTRSRSLPRSRSSAMRILQRRGYAVSRRGTMVYIYTMERTQIYLNEWEREALDRRAEESGQTRSHVIREAIAAYLQQPTVNEFEQAVLASYGAWKNRKGEDAVDGATYVERIRTGRRWRLLYPEWFQDAA